MPKLRIGGTVFITWCRRKATVMYFHGLDFVEVRHGDEDPVIYLRRHVKPVLTVRDGIIIAGPQGGAK